MIATPWRPAEHVSAACRVAQRFPAQFPTAHQQCPGCACDCHQGAHRKPAPAGERR